MYQIEVKRAKAKRARAMISSLTWKRLRNGHARVRHFVVSEGDRSGIRFDYSDEAEMVARALKEEFGLQAVVKPAALRRQA